MSRSILTILRAAPCVLVLFAACSNGSSSSTTGNPGGGSSGTSGATSNTNTSGGASSSSSSGIIPGSSSNGPMCLADGDNCMNADQCCGNRCSTVTDTCGGCFHHGVTCGNSNECCGTTPCNSEGKCGLYDYGETCSPEHQDNCAWGYCGAGNTCTCRAVGESVDSNISSIETARQCCSGKYDFETDKCTCVRTDEGFGGFAGSHCRTDGDCCDGYCDLEQLGGNPETFTGGICRQRGEGQACTSQTECASQKCTDGHCVCRVANEPCTEGNFSDQGTCCDGNECVSGTCKALIGGACQNVADCIGSPDNGFACMGGHCCISNGFPTNQNDPTLCCTGHIEDFQCAPAPAASSSSSTMGATSSATSTMTTASSQSSATSQMTTASSAAGGTWLCPDEFRTDSTCDCSCGTVDPACAGHDDVCTTPGCTGLDCDYCYAADLMSEIPCQ